MPDTSSTLARAAGIAERMRHSDAPRADRWAALVHDVRAASVSPGLDPLAAQLLQLLTVVEDRLRYRITVHLAVIDGDDNPDRPSRAFYRNQPCGLCAQDANTYVTGHPKPVTVPCENPLEHARAALVDALRAGATTVHLVQYEVEGHDPYPVVAARAQWQAARDVARKAAEGPVPAVLVDGQLVCSVCKFQDVREIDVATRVNELDANERGEVTVDIGETSDPAHDRYECGGCGARLTLDGLPFAR